MTVSRVSVAREEKDAKGYVGLLGGLPPFAPLARAALAFASERAFPPLRPSATAAGFLRRAISVAFRGLHRQLRKALCEAVHGLPVAVLDRHSAGVYQLAAAGLNRRVSSWLCHTKIIPKRLGSVKCLK